MNSSAIISRLKTVLEYYNLTSSTFADTIDVQRSSISHLMSERNKPSLDFVLKVVDKFPEVDLYWLLNGKGDFPKKKEITPPPVVKEIIKKEEKPAPSLFTQNENKEQSEDKQNQKSISTINISNNTKKLIKVVLLYNDGSFEEFNK